MKKALISGIARQYGSYLKEWVLKLHIFWVEQYSLQTFLAFNEGFEILWAVSDVHLKQAVKLEPIFSSYDRNRTLLGSF